MRPVHSIVIHHTAGRNDETAENIDRHHRRRGWRGIGYHFIITKADGVWHVQAGRDVEMKGAHAGRGFPGNLGSIGVAICGNYVNTEPPREAITVLIGLIRSLEGKYGRLHVWGHTDLNYTACPGQRLYNWIPAVRDLKEYPLYETCVRTWMIPPLRRLAVDRKEARATFRSLKQWAKGKGKR